MKLFSKTFFFCFILVLSLEFLDSISAAKFRRYGNDSGTLDGNVRERKIRSSDENEYGEKDGDDVILSGTGRINLTLIYEVLEFEICDNCAGTSRVCYESWNGWEDSDAVGSCSDPNSCEFIVKDDEDGIYFGTDRVLKTYFIPSMDGLCLSTMMKFPYAQVLPTHDYKSCEPKMDDNKMIKLFVDIDPECSIKVKNARIYLPEVTSGESKMPSTKLHLKHTSESLSFPIWGYIIIIVGIVVLIVILIIGFIAYHINKTHKPSKLIPPNVDEIKSKPTVSNANVAIVETPTNQKMKLAKVEPNMNNENKSKKSQKKDTKKKTKTQEPTITEDIPTISHQESVASVSSKQLPPPNPAACYPEVRRLIPRSMKSAKNDSLDETLKKDKSVMMESESVKF